MLDIKVYSGACGGNTGCGRKKEPRPEGHRRAFGYGCEAARADDLVRGVRAEQKKTQDREEGTKLKEQFKDQEETEIVSKSGSLNSWCACRTSFLRMAGGQGRERKQGSVPLGPDDDGSHEPKKFDFAPKDHMAARYVA